MAHDKLTKKEMKGPDQFQASGSTYLDWAHEHPKQVAVGGAALLAVIVAIGFIGERAGGPRQVNSPAGADLAAALKLVDKDVVEGVEGGADKDSFATEQQKQEAIEAALTAVRTKHPGTPAATLAALSLADARFKLGKYDEALAGYDEFLAKGPPKDALRFLGLEGRALALEAKGDLPGAVAGFDRLVAEAPLFKDRGLYGKARILEKQQKWDEARALYEQLKKEHEDSPVTRMGSERLSSLNLLHPPPPSAAPPPTAPPSAGG